MMYAIIHGIAAGVLVLAGIALLLLIAVCGLVIFGRR